VDFCEQLSTYVFQVLFIETIEDTLCYDMNSHTSSLS